MRVTVGADIRFARTPDGATWTPIQYSRRFWDRYLNVFDEVCVLGRAKNVSDVPANWLRVDGDGVLVHALPHYVGPWQYLKCSHAFRRSVMSGIESSDAVILRVGSEVARIAQPHLTRQGRPYAVEVISDAREVFAPGAIDHPLRPFFQRYFSYCQRRICAKASSISYVTQTALQRHYPPGSGAYSTYYSDVDLDDQAFVESPKLPSKNGDSLRLISVGSLAQMYKAPDVVIDAVAALAREEHDVRLTWVGDGRHRPAMEARARDLGISNRVEFLGSLPPGAAVREELDKSDLFLLVSRAEGLGRALIEAMARGLPCIGSNVGGILELLPAEDLVEPGNVEALTAKIREIASNPSRAAAMGERNLSKAKEYSAKALLERQLAFLRSVRDQAAEWQANQPRRIVTERLPS
jgi:glycosyltransferase involved in cell wall biosynthesis